MPDPLKNMKIKTPTILLFLFILFQGCTTKTAKELLEIENTNYSNSWEKLNNYPIENGRSDDLHFFDPLTGYVINSQGYLSFTEDGGKTWKVVYENEGTFLRCITFKNRLEGWLGTIGTGDESLRSRDTIALYQTNDGGNNWSPVKFIGPTPKGLCGLQKVTDQMIVGAGRVRGPSYFIKTNDGGKTWYSYDLSHLAGSLIATHFFDEENGFLIGGTTNDKKNSRSLVLKTSDGGVNWDTIYLSNQKGEYPWKFSFTTREEGYISIQRNVREGSFYHLKTEDGGESWREVEHAQDYYYTQGIGFIDKNIGWIGGSFSATYETRNGGARWNKMKKSGSGFNNFQFFGDSLAYGVGFGIFKNTDVQSTGLPYQMEYSSNGEIRGKYAFTNNKRNGPARIFHRNGLLAGKGHYKDNLKKGKWKYFDESGNLSNSVKMKKNGVVKVSSETLEKYVGDYKLDNGGIRKIMLENGQLYAQRNNRSKIPIFPETKERFFYGSNPYITVEFLKDNKGNVNSSKTFQNGEYSIAKKSSI